MSDGSEETGARDPSVSFARPPWWHISLDVPRNAHLGWWKSPFSQHQRWSIPSGHFLIATIESPLKTMHVHTLNWKLSSVSNCVASIPHIPCNEMRFHCFGEVDVIASWCLFDASGRHHFVPNHLFSSSPSVFNLVFPSEVQSIPSFLADCAYQTCTLHVIGTGCKSKRAIC